MNRLDQLGSTAGDLGLSLFKVAKFEVSQSSKVNHGPTTALQLVARALTWHHQCTGNVCVCSVSLEGLKASALHLRCAITGQRKAVGFSHRGSVHSTFSQQAVHVLACS